MASNGTGVGKNGRLNEDILAVYRYVSETIEHRHMGTMKDQ